MYSIGKLSKKTGVTVRTLDYYDEIGLLKPSEKTEGGHRLYVEEDVIKLQRILALKYMGFSLEKIKQILEESKQSLLESLKQQLEMVRKEQEHLKILEQSLIGASYSIEIEGRIDWEMIFEIIQLSQDPEAAFEAYESHLNEEQRKAVIEMSNQLSEEDMEEWVQIIFAIRENLDLDPTTDEALALVENWTNHSEKMFGNDKELLGGLAGALQNMQDGVLFYPMTKEVVDFIGRVIQHHGFIEEWSKGEDADA